ncbi:MAG: hypothetical protein PHF51_03955 [Candidatus ainarchaeum sp.]|nr:hypothetical protein [Candidatus ainarchaeum sp.]
MAPGFGALVCGPKKKGGAAAFSKLADLPEIQAAERLAGSQWKGWNERDAAVKLAAGESKDAANIILEAAMGKTRGVDPLNPTREQQMALSVAMGVISEAVTHTRHELKPSVRGFSRFVSESVLGGKSWEQFWLDELRGLETTRNLPKERVEKAFDIVADAKQYGFLADVIYTYSGFRGQAAASRFGKARTEDAKLAVAFDKDAEECRASRCMVAFAPKETFKVAAAELVREGRWYDLGEAARLAPYERAKEICDIAAENAFYGTLVNSRHNRDKRVDPYAVKLYGKITAAEVDAAAAARDWTVVGCAFEWGGGEARERALEWLAKTGHTYFAEESAVHAYLVGEHKKRTGRKAGQSVSDYDLLKAWMESRGMK